MNCQIDDECPHLNAPPGIECRECEDLKAERREHARERKLEEDKWRAEWTPDAAEWEAAEAKFPMMFA